MAHTEGRPRRSASTIRSSVRLYTSSHVLEPPGWRIAVQPDAGSLTNQPFGTLPADGSHGAPNRVSELPDVDRRKQPSDKPVHDDGRQPSDSTVQPLHQPRRRREREVLKHAPPGCFTERGYADTSVQDIADELGILKGSLYHYIEVKEDVLKLLEQLHDDTQALMEEVAATQGLTPLEQLVLYVRAQLRFDLENLPRVAVYYNDYERLSPARRAAIVARRRLHERWVSDVIERAQADGDADPRLRCAAAEQLHPRRGDLDLVVRKPRGRVSRDKIADTCAAFVLRGVVGQTRAEQANPNAMADTNVW